MSSQKEVPVKNSSGKNKNPKESGGILAGMKNRVLEMDIPETGKCPFLFIGPDVMCIVYVDDLILESRHSQD